jgi:hypothetical protein
MNARTRDEALAAGWHVIEQGRNLARLHPMLDTFEPADICERVYWLGLLTVVTVLSEIHGDAERSEVWADILARIVKRGADMQASMMDEVMKGGGRDSGDKVTRQ